MSYFENDRLVETGVLIKAIKRVGCGLNPETCGHSFVMYNKPHCGVGLLISRVEVITRTGSTKIRNNNRIECGAV